MYLNAKNILRELNKKKLLSVPEGYRLVLSGHSLGAGVVSILSLLLLRDYPDLKCYAFSPPGCIFRYIIM